MYIYASSSSYVRHQRCVDTTHKFENDKVATDRTEKRLQHPSGLRITYGLSAGKAQLSMRTSRQKVS